MHLVWGHHADAGVLVLKGRPGAGLRALLVAVPPVDEGLLAGLRGCLLRQAYLQLLCVLSTSADGSRQAGSVFSPAEDACYDDDDDNAYAATHTELVSEQLGGELRSLPAQWYLRITQPDAEGLKLPEE